MPSYNVTVDDVSPLFSYSGRWYDSVNEDPMRPLYANGTFHATHYNGASVALQFQGSAVYLYGAKRSNHDAYSVALDERAVILNGFASNPEQFQELLFSSTDLTGGQQHTLVATDLTQNDTNAPPNRPWFDIDFAVITAGDGNPSTSSRDIVLDDDATNITYTGAWDTSPNSWSNAYYLETMHRTNTTNSEAIISFHGNAISVFGATARNHAGYSVNLDGGVDMIFNGSSQAFCAQNLLYFVNGLSSSSHTLTIRNLGSGRRGFLDIDKVIVSTWSTTSSSSVLTPVPSAAATPGHASPAAASHSNGGKIAGGVVGTILALALLAGLILFFLRRRAHERRRQSYRQRTHESVPRAWPEKSEAWTTMADRLRRISHIRQ